MREGKGEREREGGRRERVNERERGVMGGGWSWRTREAQRTDRHRTSGRLKLGGKARP